MDSNPLLTPLGDSFSLYQEGASSLPHALSYAEVAISLEGATPPGRGSEPVPVIVSSPRSSSEASNISNPKSIGSLIETSSSLGLIMFSDATLDSTICNSGGDGGHGRAFGTGAPPASWKAGKIGSSFTISSSPTRASLTLDPLRNLSVIRHRRISDPSLPPIMCLDFSPSSITRTEFLRRK